MDTQIGTRPQIGVLEIHQAYILASLNWLQQTRSLEMNHVAIEKAKLLGFDHSSVITHAEITDITVNDVIFADRNAKKSMLGNSIFQDL